VKSHVDLHAARAREPLLTHLKQSR
jgi:hypothetical protein